MRCLDAGEIARALTPGLDDPHFRECLACRRQLDADRTARDALRVLPPPRLGSAHRAALAAELLATAERRPRPAQLRARWLVGGSAVALAATISLVAWWPRAPEPLVAAHVVASTESAALGARSVASDDSPPSVAAPVIDATRGTTFRHATGHDRDVITLVDGALELDTRFARKVDVRVGDSIIHVDNAAVKIEARTRAIVSVRVIVGAAHIESPQQHVTLQRDSEWIPAPAAPTSTSAEPTAKARSLTAFRDAWIALRAGLNREAMALFDSVTDDVALEEASYWAVIAARRAGDASLSARIETFLRTFPQSEYADELRAAQ